MLSCRMFLFLIYFPRATPNTPRPDTDKEPPSYRSAVIVVLVCIAYAVALGIATTYIVLAQPGLAWKWADALGITGTALAAIQYFPQIYTTYKLQSLGSLSIPMMCVQTPGGYLWAASLAARLGWEGWSAWMLYVFISTLQGVVLGMGLYFKWRKAGQKDASDDEDDDGQQQYESGSSGHTRVGDAEDGDGTRNEATPLLRSEN